jgi:hypothetical protein
MTLVKPKPPGEFSFCIPFKHIFGFGEDHRRVLYGVTHRLILTRQGDDSDAIFRAANGKITLTKLAWYIPHVKPSLHYRNELVKIIAAKKDVSIAFRGLQCENIPVTDTTSFPWQLFVCYEGLGKPPLDSCRVSNSSL